MKNKFLKMAFMALCLSTSSVVHAMHEEGDKQPVRAPVFSGKYKIEGGSVTVNQADKGVLNLHVNLEDTPAVRDSINPKTSVKAIFQKVTTLDYTIVLNPLTGRMW